PRPQPVAASISGARQGLGQRVGPPCIADEPREPERIPRQLQRLQRRGASEAQGLRADDVGGDRAGAAVAGAVALAHGGTADPPVATVALGPDRPQALGAAGDSLERRADDAVPTQAACATETDRSDLRRQRFDGTLLAAPHDLRPRDRTTRRPRGLRFLDASDANHKVAATARSRPGARLREQRRARAGRPGRAAGFAGFPEIEMREVLQELNEWTRTGEDIAIATVIETWGSSPRPLGSKMLVTRSGKMAGSVSNGCIEGAVFDEGQTVLKSGTPKIAAFGVADEVAFEVGLACGGHIEVFVQPLGNVHRQLVGMLNRDEAATLRTNLTTGEAELVSGTPPGTELPRRDGDVFVEPFRRPAHLVIIGAIDIALPPHRLAELRGCRVA